MSDIKLPEGFILEEEITEEVPKELDLNNIPDEAKPVEDKGIPFFGDKFFSDENRSKTFSEETVRSAFKIVDKIRGKEVEEDASLAESLIGAGISAGIKIPKGLITFGTLLYDITQDEGIPYNETLTGKLTEAFDRTTLGKIEQAAEEVADETAAGKITEAIGQLYGAGKIMQKTAVPVIEKGSKYVRQLVNGIKSGRYVKTTNNIKAARTAKKAADLNRNRHR